MAASGEADATITFLKGKNHGQESHHNEEDDPQDCQAETGPEGSRQIAGEKKAVTKKMSALDAAAKVLSESKEPLNTKELIAKMA